MQIRIVTWNIRLGIQKGLDEVVRVINELNPDILLVQEIGFFWSMGPQGNVPLTIAMSCGFDYFDFAPTLDTNTFRLVTRHSKKTNDAEEGPPSESTEKSNSSETQSPIPIPSERPLELENPGFFGHALFCRAPITAKRDSTIHLPSGVGIEPRLILVSHLSIPTETPTDIFLLSTHLSHLEDRRTQGESLTHIFRDFKGKNLIFGGDLNESTEPVWFPVLDYYMTRAPNDRPTYPSDNPTEQIDYLFSNAGTWKGAYVAETGDVSDHLPLVADLIL